MKQLSLQEAPPPAQLPEAEQLPGAQLPPAAEGQADLGDQQVNELPPSTGTVLQERNEDPEAEEPQGVLSIHYILIWATQPATSILLILINSVAYVEREEDVMPFSISGAAR